MSHADKLTRECALQECRGRPRCGQCRMLDEMYPPQRNLSGRGDALAEAEATIPTARLIELETAEHERDILRHDIDKLGREAHTWSKAAETYATELERHKPLMQAVEWILEDGHMNQEHLARLRAAWDGA